MVKLYNRRFKTFINYILKYIKTDKNIHDKVWKKVGNIILGNVI